VGGAKSGRGEKWEESNVGAKSGKGQKRRGRVLGRVFWVAFFLGRVFGSRFFLGRVFWIAFTCKALPNVMSCNGSRFLNSRPFKRAIFRQNRLRNESRRAFQT
jgi:hypothetical protein